jgi:hypothetical protein
MGLGGYEKLRTGERQEEGDVARTSCRFVGHGRITISRNRDPTIANQPFVEEQIIHWDLYE